MVLHIRTERLQLRAFHAGDASRFRELASDWDVARMTSDIPHPLSEADAERWLRPSGGEARFALERDGHLIGGAGYFRRASGAAELGFWLGRAFWGQGFATEAVKAVVAHGFTVGAHRAFTSSHFADNPASRRVLLKCGFERSGVGRIWSLARGVEVEAEYYWLTRERAEQFIGLPRPAARRGRLSQLLERVKGV